MAKDDKTEKPTAKRRSEASKRGNFARSTDLVSAGVLGAGLLGFIFTASTIASVTAAQMASSFGKIAHPGAATSVPGLLELMHEGIGTILATVAPIAIACLVAGVLLNGAQTKFRLSTKAIKPSFSKLNPISGVKQLFSPQKLFETVKSLAKVAVMGGVIALALVPDLTRLGAAVGTSPHDLGLLMSSSAIAVAERAVLAYLLIGLVDYAWNRRRHEQGLKMSKQEIKEESRNRELPAEVRRAIRRKQYQQHRARMMAAVPKADVVITNPTHYAVALQYDGTRPAPVVVAKGQDLVALQIRRIAEESEVPIISDPPLARELHRVVEIGQMIPADLYAAVAQVLAFVYRMAGRRKASV